MTTTYAVTTPLGERPCDSPKAVCEIIDEYMQQSGARLTSVLVSKRSDQQAYFCAGEVLEPADFSPELCRDDARAHVRLLGSAH